jgi:hypothetical protein
MHNENEKERFDDVFIIVIILVLVRNLPNIGQPADPLLREPKQSC